MNENALQELTYDECLALLGAATIGRIIYTDGALPVCTPVNYALHGHAVVFRTAPGSRLAMATEDAVVAFEVDAIDPATRSGWSVLVTGIAEAPRDVRVLLRLEQLGLASWAGSDRSHWVRITPSLMSGRRIGPSPAATPTAAVPTAAVPTAAVPTAVSTPAASAPSYAAALGAGSAEGVEGA